MTHGNSERRPGVIMGTLGVTQILAWGSTYYLPAVLAKPIAADMGWPLTWVIAGLSIGLLVAGLVSPRVGHLIQSRGGRRVLAFSSTGFGLGLIGIAIASSITGYLVAWAVLGLAMASGLYDAAFATLGRLYGVRARAAITTLTLFGGFASTVCWPLSALLLETVGWRHACLVYAGLHLAIALPAHLVVLPGAAARDAAASGPAAPKAGDDAETDPPGEQPLTQGQRALFVMIATSITLGGIITSVMSVHLLSILQARGVTLAAAVSLGALVGPSQVGARVYELSIGRRFHPTWTFIVSACLIAGGLALLLLAFPLVAIGLMLYGGGVGVMTIARVTLPLVIFGASSYAVLMGRLALPSLLAQAIAPSAAALLLEHESALYILTILMSLAFLNLALIVALRTVLQSNRAGGVFHCCVRFARDRCKGHGG
jgi:MFS family permease